MTKKILVPLLVAPLILSGCGNGKKALKPFEKGDALLNAELIKFIVGEKEEFNIKLSESTFVAPEGFTAPEADPYSGYALIDEWKTTDAESVETSHYVSLLSDKEILSAKHDAGYLASGLGILADAYSNLFGFGYAYAASSAVVDEDTVYSYKAVDACGNVLVDWSGKDLTKVTSFTAVCYYDSDDEDHEDPLLYLLEYSTWKENHWEKSYKMYSEDFLSLDDVAYFPESGEAVTYKYMEFEKDGKSYYAKSRGTGYDVFEVSDKGDKVVFSFDYPKHEAFYAFGEYSYISVTDRVVSPDSAEFTYIADKTFASSFEGQGDTEGDFEGEISLPVGEEKHLQEVHIYDMYNFKETVVASPYYISDFSSLGLEDYDIDEEVLEDPYVYVAVMCDVDENGKIDVDDEEIGLHYFLADQNFGLHDDLSLAQMYALMGYLTPFGDGYIDSYDGIIYDELLNRVAVISSGYEIKKVLSDYIVLSSKNLSDVSMYAIADKEGKLVTGFDYASVTPVDDTHFFVKDAKNAIQGILDVNSGIKWFDPDKVDTDGVFMYVEKGEGENIKYDAYFNGIFFKEVAEKDLLKDGVVYEVVSPTGDYQKLGVLAERADAAGTFDIVWYKAAF